MKKIRFNKYYKKPLLEDIKITTIRNQKKCRTNEVCCATTENDETICKIRVHQIQPIKYKDLTQEIAWNDGFKHIDLLKKELKTIYPYLNDNDELFIHHFTRIIY